jgi:hypothetical protein
MLEMMVLPPDLSARRDLFLEELKTMPWAFEYLTLHFLVGDSLNYGFDKVVID